MLKSTLSNLEILESEAIHIIREVVAQADNPVMLYSIGKDSAVMLHLAKKAFYPGNPPFPLLHVDTTWKFREMYELRDKSAQKAKMDLLVFQNPEALEKGIAVKTSSFSRHHVNVTMCKAKANGNYMNSILAHQEAINDGYNEALLLDTQGFVSEGSGENIFLVKNGHLITPSLSSALEGITRDTIIEIAKAHDMQVIEKNITRDEVYTADEAFFTGTAAEVTPIRELDRRNIGKGARGEVTEFLQKTYFDIVSGKNTKYGDWLTYV